MLDISTIVGITLMVIGGVLVTIGLVLCYTTKVCLSFNLRNASQAKKKKKRKEKRKSVHAHKLKHFIVGILRVP